MEQQYATEIWTNEHRCKFLFLARAVWDVGESPLLHVIFLLPWETFPSREPKLVMHTMKLWNIMSRINYFTRNTWVTEPREAEVDMWPSSILIYKVRFELYGSVNIY